MREIAPGWPDRNQGLGRLGGGRIGGACDWGDRSEIEGTDRDRDKEEV